MANSGIAAIFFANFEEDTCMYWRLQLINLNIVIT